MSIDRYTGSPDIRYYPLPSNSTENSCFRFLSKENNQCERDMVSNVLREQINLYGTQVTYFVNTYNPALTSDNFYGEQPLSQYGIPISFIAYIDLNENSLLLSKYGFQSDDDITMYVHISSFYEAYHKPALSAYFHGYAIEPKSGDVFKLTEYGSDRPGERDGKMFEITERLDQDINKINPLMGHYMWLLKAKRYESSFEPGLPQEKGNGQVFDEAKVPVTYYDPYEVNTLNQNISVFNTSFNLKILPTVQSFNIILGENKSLSILNHYNASMPYDNYLSAYNENNAVFTVNPLYQTNTTIISSNSPPYLTFTYYPFTVTSASSTFLLVSGGLLGADKNYKFDVNEESKIVVFDGKNNTSVYGDYD